MDLQLQHVPEATRPKKVNTAGTPRVLRFSSVRVRAVFLAEPNRTWFGNFDKNPNLNLNLPEPGSSLNRPNHWFRLEPGLNQVRTHILVTFT